jgi:ElaB/YqjD/DUF883 family membrane-anchored ribosome-binding protein
MHTDPENSGPRPARDVFLELLSEWRELAGRLLKEAEEYTRQKPAAGLAAAFLAGLVAGTFLRRR